MGIDGGVVWAIVAGVLVLAVLVVGLVRERKL